MQLISSSTSISTTMVLPIITRHAKIFLCPWQLNFTILAWNAILVALQKNVSIIAKMINQSDCFLALAALSFRFCDLSFIPKSKNFVFVDASIKYLYLLMSLFFVLANFIRFYHFLENNFYIIQSPIEQVSIKVISMIHEFWRLLSF